MFSTRRLSHALSSCGFFLASRSETDARFVRANVQWRIFEQVYIGAGKPQGGKWGDVSGADVSIALTPGPFTSPKGMAEAICLSNWAPTESEEKAIAWERLVTGTALAKIDDLLGTHGDELLERTADARAAVERYLAILDRHLTVAQMIADLTDGATADELAEAHRLSRTTGFIGLPERHCYDLVSLLISRRATDIETSPTRFWGKDPYAVPELNWRCQLLASRLYPERGWELLDACPPPQP